MRLWLKCHCQPPSDAVVVVFIPILWLCIATRKSVDEPQSISVLYRRGK